MTVAGEEKMAEPDREYQRIYRNFVQLVRERRSDVDLPADPCGRCLRSENRHLVEAFDD